MYSIGTFLPEVSEQQNWDQEETVAHLVRKAGYRGDLSESLFASIHCSRYQSSKYRMTYKDYVKVIGRDPIRQAANYDSNEKG
jgi:AMMECR1 domain-containing protein